MAKLQCKNCLGVWITPDAYGYVIYHACSPISADGGLTYTESPTKLDTNIKLLPNGTKTTVLPGKGTDVLA